MKWTLVHGHFVAMGGLEVESMEGTRTLIGATRINLLHLRQNGTLVMPFVEEADILDKSKSSYATKFIACLQIGWFVTQLIGRANQHIPVTTLELFTVAIVGCTLMNYSLWWKKPLDVRRPLVIRTSIKNEDIQKNPSLREKDRTQLNRYAILVVGFTGCLIGGCHLLAWDFSFATEVEQFLWRVLSLTCITCSLLLAFILFPRITHLRWLFWGLVVVYIVVRLALLVLVFVALRSVPAGVYQSIDWSSYIPHI